MDHNGNITKSTDNSNTDDVNVRRSEGNTVNVIERRSEATEDRELGYQIWRHCCRFNRREMEFAVANLHHGYVLRKQRTSQERWLEITRLRSMEIHQKKRGLVLQFITWMEKLDRRLADDGIFVESEAKKYMEHPVLGYIPEYDYESVITKVG